MAISTIIYSNANTKSKTVTVDFLADLLSSSSNGTSDEIKYFFKFSTDAKDEDGLSYHIKVIEDFETLALVDRQKINGSASDYANIKSMVVDYLVDYVHGHTAGESGSSATYRAAMDFS